MAYSTIVFGNETEAVAFAEKNEYGTKDIKAIAEKIAEIPLEGKAGAKRMVIITQGEIWAENKVFPHFNASSIFSSSADFSMLYIDSFSTGPFEYMVKNFLFLLVST